MTAVDVPADEVAALVAIEPSCGIAAVNGPQSTVVSGPAEAVDRITGQLVGRGAKATSLAVSHAFHSPLMAPAQQAFRDVVGAISPRKATIPLVSTLHGRPVDGTDMDADYWATQITSPVLFADAITAATAQQPTHLVELGPRSTLLALARRCGIGTQTRTLAMCTGPDDDGAGVARAAARLYADGLPTTAFDSLYGDDSLTLKRLPPYAFGDGTRFWREVDVAAPVVPAPFASALPDDDSAAATPAGVDSVAARVRQAIAEIGGYKADEINPNALLGEDLGYDSLLQLRLVERLRTEYPQLENATVDELVRAIKDVDDLVRYVEDRIGSEAMTR